MGLVSLFCGCFGFQKKRSEEDVVAEEARAVYRGELKAYETIAFTPGKNRREYSGLSIDLERQIEINWDKEVQSRLSRSDIKPALRVVRRGKVGDNHDVEKSLGLGTAIRKKRHPQLIMVW